MSKDKIIARIARVLAEGDAVEGLTRSLPATDLQSLMLQVYRNHEGLRLNLADGGFTTWTQRLLSNAKERLLVAAQVFREDRTSRSVCAPRPSQHLWAEAGPADAYGDSVPVTVRSACESFSRDGGGPVGGHTPGVWRLSAAPGGDS